MLGHTAWSVRVADRDPQRLKAAENQWEKGLGTAQGSGLGTGSVSAPAPGLGRISRAKSEGVAPVGATKGKGKKDKESPQRTWGMLPSALCDHLPAHSLVSAHIQSVSKELHNPAVATTVTDTSSSSTPSPSTPTSKVCKSTYTHPINRHTPYQYTLSTHPINTPYQHTLSTHPINTS